MKKFGLAALWSQGRSRQAVDRLRRTGAGRGRPVNGITALGHGSALRRLRQRQQLPWRDQLVPRVYVPHVDTSVRN